MALSPSLLSFSVAFIELSGKEDGVKIGISWFCLSLALIPPTVDFHAFHPTCPNGHKPPWYKTQDGMVGERLAMVAASDRVSPQPQRKQGKL